MNIQPTAYPAEPSVGTVAPLALLTFEFLSNSTASKPTPSIDIGSPETSSPLLKIFAIFLSLIS
jgi:hypothetical protein